MYIHKYTHTHTHTCIYVVVNVSASAHRGQRRMLDGLEPELQVIVRH